MESSLLEGKEQGINSRTRIFAQQTPINTGDRQTVRELAGKSEGILLRDLHRLDFASLPQFLNIADASSEGNSREFRSGRCLLIHDASRSIPKMDKDFL